MQTIRINLRLCKIDNSGRVIELRNINQEIFDFEHDRHLILRKILNIIDKLNKILLCGN